MGLPTVSLAFADRGYMEDGSLVPRGQPGDMIKMRTKPWPGVIRMVKEGKVTTSAGKVSAIKAESILVHGDGAHAVEFVLALKAAFHREGIQIKNFAQ